jgi:hypothetical protein
MIQTHHLRALEHKLESIVSSTKSPRFLGPPLPTTAEEISAWRQHSPLPPILPQWQPPEWINKCEGGKGFLLNDQTACFQRGYCPEAVYDSIMQELAKGFHHDPNALAQRLCRDGYDYIIAIRNHETHEIAAACLVELRCCSCACANNVPYLYIYELTTSPAFGRHGLAQQLIHAVDALGFLMKSDQCATNMWYNTLQNKRLLVGLTVDDTQDVGCVNGLVQLYSRGGMKRRDQSLPLVDYRSFSLWSDTDWCIDNNPSHYIAMWKEINLSVMYSDNMVNIVKDGSCAVAKYYYHAFPKDKLASVKVHGILHPAHGCLHGGGTQSDTRYTPGGCTLTFTHTKPTAVSYVFAVKAQCSTCWFDTHISIPSWYAAFIGCVGDLPLKYKVGSELHRSIHNQLAE